MKVSSGFTLCPEGLLRCQAAWPRAAAAVLCWEDEKLLSGKMCLLRDSGALSQGPSILRVCARAVHGGRQCSPLGVQEAKQKEGMKGPESQSASPAS